MILYRPVGLAELKLIEEKNYLQIIVEIIKHILNLVVVQYLQLL